VLHLADEEDEDEELGEGCEGGVCGVSDANERTERTLMGGGRGTRVVCDEWRDVGKVREPV
jgi:hypothetical protein